MSKMELRVECWSLDRLIPYINNPRTHDHAQVAQVAASIDEFGFCNPILASADGLIIAGHARLLAAHKLGLAEVPVIVLSHLSDAQRRALVIADNQLALNAGWNEELLRVEIAALQNEGFSLDLIGFADEELARLLAEQDKANALTDEDSIPDLLKNPVSKVDDLWTLGPHKLLVGDATDRADRWYGNKSQSTLWQENKPAANRDHPTAKPVELVTRALVNSSQPGDLIVDLFGGSGTTLIACERLSRKARLMEIDPLYADVIIRRHQQHTGKSAVLEGDGRTFDQVTHLRCGESSL